MKRDMDLIRSLLMGIESVPSEQRAFYLPSMSREIDHHLKLLTEHRLIALQYGPARDDDVGKWYVFATLTWDGHDFVDAVRDEAVWKHTKEGAKAVGGFSFDILKALAKAFLKKQIEARLGIEVDF
jgi:hypothetical protein